MAEDTTSRPRVSSFANPLTGRVPTPSYVYPVKSLLSGRIQPANDQQPASPALDASQRAHLPDNVLGLAHRDHLPHSMETSRSRNQYWTKDDTDALRRGASVTRSHPSSVSPRRSKSISDIEVSELTSFQSRRTKPLHVPPNFRHFPAEDNPRNFSSYPSGSVFSPTSSSRAIIETVTTGYMGGPGLVARPDSSQDPEPLPTESGIISTPVPPAVSGTFAATSDPLPLKDALPNLPFNPSEYGLVHLPPPPASSSLWQSKGGRIPTPSRSSGPNSQKSASLKLSSSRSSSASHERLGSAQKNDTVEGLAPPSVSSGYGLLSDSRPQGGSFAHQSSLSLGGGTVSEEPLVTFRYQHAQDEHGNHVVIGREGQLQRCEDEVTSNYRTLGFC